MPMRRDLYPANWDATARAVKEAAHWICQNCGMQCRTPDETFDTHRRTMTVAHLNHDPADCRPGTRDPVLDAAGTGDDAVPLDLRAAHPDRRRRRLAAAAAR